MTSLLQHSEVLPTLVTDLCAVVSHTLCHLLQLLVVRIDGSLAALVGVSNFGQAPLEDGFRFLHLSLAL